MAEIQRSFTACHGFVNDPRHSPSGHPVVCGTFAFHMAPLCDSESLSARDGKRRHCASPGCARPLGHWQVYVTTRTGRHWHARRRIGALIKIGILFQGAQPRAQPPVQPLTAPRNPGGQEGALPANDETRKTATRSCERQIERRRGERSKLRKSERTQDNEEDADGG